MKYGYHQSSFEVRGNFRGDYHCSPRSSFPCNPSSPDGYDHSLYVHVVGWSNGRGHCWHDYTGDIVAGPFGYNL